MHAGNAYSGPEGHIDMLEEETQAPEIPVAEAVAMGEQDEVALEAKPEFLEEGGQRRNDGQPEAVVGNSRAGHIIGPDGNRMIDGGVEDGVGASGEKDIPFAFATGQDGDGVSRLVDGNVLQRGLREPIADESNAILLSEGRTRDFAKHDAVGENDLADFPQRALYFGQ